MGLKALNAWFNTHPLTRDKPYAAWIRFVVWQVISRAKRVVLFNWLGRLKVAAVHGMTGFTGNIYVGLHEFEEMAFTIHFLRKDDCFCDIGANVGSYTMLAAGVCRARVFSFEPDPTTALALRANIAENKLGELVTVYQCALGAKQGNVAFTIGNGATNKVATEDLGNAQEVREEKLDDVIAGTFPVMMKIDVEGYEDAVLSGAVETLAHPGLQVIQLETVTEWARALLGAHGFKQIYYSPLIRTIRLYPSDDMKAANSIFIRDEKFISDRVSSAVSITVLGREV